jgi:hypothetical protein
VTEDVLQAALQDRRQPNLSEPVGAAPASMRRMFLGHAPADGPVDPRLNHRRGDALATQVVPGAAARLEASARK